MCAMGGMVGATAPTGRSRRSFRKLFGEYGELDGWAWAAGVRSVGGSGVIPSHPYLVLCCRLIQQKSGDGGGGGGKGMMQVAGRDPRRAGHSANGDCERGGI